MSSSVQLDPYTANAQNDEVTLAQKIKGTCVSWGTSHEDALPGRSPQDYSRCPDGYAHNTRLKWVSPFESYDTNQS
jgi:hypothetical protein